MLDEDPDEDTIVGDQNIVESISERVEEILNSVDQESGDYLRRKHRPASRSPAAKKKKTSQHPIMSTKK